VVIQHENAPDKWQRTERHTFGGRRRYRSGRCASTPKHPMSVCKRVTMPLTSPGVESATRAMTKRKRRLDSGMAVLKLDSWGPIP